MAKVLLVDDELTMVQMVAELLRAEGHEVSPHTNAASALEALDTIQPELVITDLYLDKNKRHGFDILKKAKAMNPPAVVIMITGFGSIETAVEAMKHGAYDYLEKPFKLDELRLCVQRALSYNDAISENVFLKKQLGKQFKFNQIIGKSPAMQEVFRLIERVADTDSTILILGESGTGKELAARALHFNSRRQHAPFIPVNCSALPENLLESELFGHRKGAFTGALTDKKGLFAEADGGTIFLDEIGSMPPLLQSRLLRVLQEKEVRRVGDNTPTFVNVRVLAATNEPLEERIKKGTFREDLFYRLNVIPITLPCLRERVDDIPLLVSHFLRDKVHYKSGKPFQMTHQAMDALLAHDWPGNVRELQNAIERATALCEDAIIQVRDLPPVIQKYVAHSTDTVFETRSDAPPSSLVILSEGLYPLATQTGGGWAPAEAAGFPGAAIAPDAAPEDIGPLKDYLRNQESAYLNRALSFTAGDKEKAAEILGISLATLYRKLSEVEESA
jgi:DNA-binding NtrC family response regulator